MKILHTADWHIGKILHKQELYEELALFFDWLEAYILEEKIDVLLVAGDIFDMANPSNKDTKLYYTFLQRLSRTAVRTIITGGNHDSVSLLNAAADLLTELNITVVGGVPDDFNAQLVPIYDKNKKLECVVLAVPFLRDRDLRLSVSADQANEKQEIIPIAIKQHYDRLVSSARDQYGNIPLIAMGHLFMQGSMISDSEREIHVGNLGGLDCKLISSEISYMALGHIHKPQRIDKKDHVRYSGSPIYLDFSEVKYEKMVVQVELSENILNIKPIPIPKFRNLLRVKGSLSDISKQLSTYVNQFPLKTFVELEILEETSHISTNHLKQELENETSEHFKVIKSVIQFADKQQKDHFVVNQQITMESMNPRDILERRLETETIEEKLKDDIRIEYQAVLESLLD